MSNTQAAGQAPVVDEAALAEMHRLIFDAPIAELAENQGITIDEAVALRVEKNLEAATAMEVSVRPIAPQGKVIGFASINFGGVVVDDFKIVDGANGLFVGMPSKPAPGTRSGYRATVRVADRELQDQMNAAAAQAYTLAVEKLVARADAVRPPSIREQMDKAEQAAGKKNASRTPPAKGKEGREDR